MLPSSKVMMVGTDLKSKGGISSVLNAYKNSGLLDALNIKYYSTHRDGLKIGKIIYYIKVIPNIIFMMHKSGRTSSRRWNCGSEAAPCCA